MGGGGGAREENKIFVGGLSRDITHRQLEHAFSRFGKILDSLIMLERDTGRPRGFGFITFADRRGMEDAIKEMHGRELGDRVISVNKAEPKMGDSINHGYRGGYPSGGRGNYGGGDRPAAKDECFKCGRTGHWARDCPSGGGRGGPLPLGRGDRFGADRYRGADDRYVGRHGDRDRYDDVRYGGRGADDRYVGDRYPPGGNRYGGDRYGGSTRYTQYGFGEDGGYDRDGGARAGGRFGNGGPARNEVRSYRDRMGPYDRPSRVGRPSSYDRY